MKREKRKSRIILQLAKANDKKQRKNNWLYIITLAFTILLLVSTFGIARGKIQTEQLKNMRSAGTASNVFLLNATMEQYKKVKLLSYVENVGVEKTVAGIYDNKDNMICSCTVLDSTGYHKLLSPSITNIVGNYPKKQNEIFMSKKALKALGIQKPKLGMRISLNINWFDWMINKEHNKTNNRATYILSGYYTSYEDDKVQTVPKIYFSKDFLKENDEKLFPGKLLISTKYGFINPFYIEKQLYQDITLVKENQQFIVEKSSSFNALENFAGGFSVVLFCALIICLSAYLFIYNLISISLNHIVRQLGLLESIGMTKKQIQKMLFLQTVKKTALGCIYGGIISMVVHVSLVRVILEKLYLQGLGKANIVHDYMFETLLYSILFVCFISFFASYKAFKKIKRLSPIEATNYYSCYAVEDFSKREKGKQKKQGRQQKKRTKNGSKISHMAWRNLKREKAKLGIAFFALWLGCEVVLGFCVLEKGTDPIHKLEQNYDFELGISEDSLNQYLDTVKFQNKAQKRLFTDEDINQIIKLACIKKEDIKISQGGYGFIKTDLQDAFEPRNQSLEDEKNYNNYVTVQIIEKNTLKKLNTYVLAEQENVQVPFVINKKGAILLHKNELSLTLKKQANQVLDKKFSIYSSYVSMSENKNVKNISCEGYMDTTKNAFPNLDLTFHGNGINYLIVSEDGFKQLGLTKQFFHISFSVPPKKEAWIKEELKQWVAKKNSRHTQFYIVANSDKIAEAKGYIHASRMLMQVISTFLIAMGILNYLNTKFADLLLRKKEFAISESIGMTRKQLQKMLMLEGMYFCTLLFGCLVTIGTAGIWIFGKMIRLNLVSFQFYYPIIPMLLLIVSFMTIAIVAPQLYFWQMMKRSTIENLKKEE